MFHSLLLLTHMYMSHKVFLLLYLINSCQTVFSPFYFLLSLNRMFCRLFRTMDANQREQIVSVTSLRFQVQ